MVNCLRENDLSTLREIRRAIRCLDATNRKLEKMIGSGGGGGTPGGADGQIQYNNAGAFGADAGLTTDKAGSLTATGIVQANSGLTIGGSNQELRFYEGANYVGFEAPALTGDQIWALPDADGNANDFLQTDGAGNLAWAAGGGGGGLTIGDPIAGGAANRVLFEDGANQLAEDANFQWGGSNLLASTNASSVSAASYYDINGSRLISIDGTNTLRVGAGITGVIGSYSTHLGSLAGNGSTGVYNTHVGYYAGRNVTGTGNQFVGSLAAAASATVSGNYNYLAGFQCGYNLTSGSANFLMGRFCGFDLTVNNNNLMIGDNAGRFATGQSNVLLGDQSGYGASGVSVFSAVVAIGSKAGFSLRSAGSNSVHIGAFSGYTNQNDGVYIGYAAGYYETAVNKLFIDNAVRASEADGRVKSLVYGTFNAATTSQYLRINANTEVFNEGDSYLDIIADTDNDSGDTDALIRWGHDGTRGAYTLDAVAGYDQGDGVIKLGYGDNPLDWYLNCGTEKTLELQEAVWDDFNNGAFTSSVSNKEAFKDSAGGDLTPTGFVLDEGDYADGHFEFEHSYKEGSDYYFHIHWQGQDAFTGTDKVKFQLTYFVSSTGSTVASETTITWEVDASTDYAFYTSSSAVISGTGVEIGDQFTFRLERVAPSADAYAGKIILQTVGIHAQVNTMGSRQTTSK